MLSFSLLRRQGLLRECRNGISRSNTRFIGYSAIASGIKSSRNFSSETSSPSETQASSASASSLSQPSSTQATSSPTIFNIPNSLSLLRIAAIPPFCAAYYISGPAYTVIPTGLFALSAATDFLDGVLARKLNQQTRLGSWLDPVADKLVVCSSLMLIIEKFANPWVTIPSLVICCREVGVGSLRELYSIAPDKTTSTNSNDKQQLGVGNLGKWKTTFQLLSLIALFYADFPETQRKETQANLSGPNETTKVNVDPDFHLPYLNQNDPIYVSGIACLWLAAGLSVVSGRQYGKIVWAKKKLAGW